MVKVEGTLDELREIFANRKGMTGDERVTKARKMGTAPSQRKPKRKLSDWQKYIKNKKNHVKFKSGARKGRLDLAKMSKNFKKSRRK